MEVVTYYNQVKRKEVYDMPVAALIKIAVGIALMAYGAPAVF